MDALTNFMATFVGYAWGLPLIVLLIGGGLFLTVLSGLKPLVRVAHAIRILSGKYDKNQDPGQISHFQALSTALAATVGVGNIGGVAIAIQQGGAGAVFWMWLAAVVGMTTKFFSCTLSQLYRKPDELGVVQGGPMISIEVGLGTRWKPLAIMFATFGMIGCLPMFQTNQLASIMKTQLGVDPLWTSIAATVFVAIVAAGGIERIGRFTARLVPAMCVLYLGLSLLLISTQLGAVPDIFVRIFTEAFTGQAAAGGAAGIAFREVLKVGVKRAAFSNEAGLGTAPLAHGAAKTNEPVREGLVAMLGPFIDTIVVCTLTALVILLAAPAASEGLVGVSLTAAAFEAALGSWSGYLLVLVISMFAVTTMVSYSYYGRRCFAYLFGARRAGGYTYFYLAGLFLGGMWSSSLVINTIDSAFAMMAIPNMIVTLLLAPKVMVAAKDYFRRLEAGEFD